MRKPRSKPHTSCSLTWQYLKWITSFWLILFWTAGSDKCTKYTKVHSWMKSIRERNACFHKNPETAQPKRKWVLENHDGNSNWNLNKQRVSWAQQWLCTCVINLCKFLCVLCKKKQREMIKLRVVWRTWTAMAKNFYFKFNAVFHIQFRDSFYGEKQTKWL